MGLEVFAVTSSVWCLRRPSYLTCSYVVRTADQRIVLVDAGMDSSGGDIEQALARAFGATPEDVSAVLLTHWHNDHAAGARAVQERSRARITPGHTPGHVSFYYVPERILFAGDALAVIDQRVRFMARPVTPDLGEARRSMLKCLRRSIAHLCPGHRLPLSSDVEARCNEMLGRLEANAPWPLFG